MSRPTAKERANKQQGEKRKNPEQAKPSESFAQGKLVGMTFNVPKFWHTEFKMNATLSGVSMHDFLFEIYDVWKANYDQGYAGALAPSLRSRRRCE